MWYTASKKEHIRIRWWYNLLIKIKTGGDKSILEGERGMWFLVTGKHDLDLTLLLPTQRNRLWQGRGWLSKSQTRAFCRGPSWPPLPIWEHRLTHETPWDFFFFFCLVARPIILVHRPICRRHGFWLLQTSATFSVVAKHSKPDRDTLGEKEKGATVPWALWQYDGGEDVTLKDGMGLM